MDIDKVTAILDRMPVKSDYEFKHFELEAQGSWHRQMRYALERKEELHHQLEIASAEVDLGDRAIQRVEKDYSKGEVPFRRRILEAELAMRKRMATNLRKELEQVDKWLDGHKPEECADAANSFDQSEPENWTEQVGRQVGIELLADVKASKDSMAKMSLMPLNDYKKAVLITNQFAAFLKRTAEQVEATLSPNKPQELPTTAPQVPPAAAQKPAAQEPKETQVQRETAADKAPAAVTNEARVRKPKQA